MSEELDQVDNLTELGAKHRIEELEKRNKELTAEIETQKRVLKETEEKYQSIFNNAAVGIAQTTSEGKFIAANRAFAEILGYPTPEELIATISDIAQQLFVDPGNRKEKLSRMSLAKGVVRHIEERLYRKDGSIAWDSVNARVVRNEEGRV